MGGIQNNGYHAKQTQAQSGRFHIGLAQISNQSMAKDKDNKEQNAKSLCTTLTIEQFKSPIDSPTRIIQPSVKSGKNLISER